MTYNAAAKRSNLSAEEINAAAVKEERGAIQRNQAWYVAGKARSLELQIQMEAMLQRERDSYRR